MFYSHKLEDEKFLLFSLFINNILQGKKDYSEKVNSVIKEATELIKGEKDFYTINRDNYPITVFLSKVASEFLYRIDVEAPTNKDYKELLEIIEHQSPVHLA